MPLIYLMLLGLLPYVRFRLSEQRTGKRDTSNSEAQSSRQGNRYAGGTPYDSVGGCAP